MRRLLNINADGPMPLKSIDTSDAPIDLNELKVYVQENLLYANDAAPSEIKEDGIESVFSDNVYIAL